MTNAVTTAAPADEPNGIQRFNWIGLTPAQMSSIAKAMALSGMFPDIARDSAKAFVKIMAGQEMGIPPFQAMNDISIIAGKAAAGGNLYAAKVKSNPKYDYQVKAWNSKGCAIEFFQIEQGKKVSLGISQFDENDAKRAGLIGKGNWKTYPRNMYFNRAMTAGVRTYCPDALGGVTAYTPEELGANVDEEGNFVSMDEETKAVDVPVEQIVEKANDSVPVDPDTGGMPDNFLKPEDEPEITDEDIEAVEEPETEPEPPKPRFEMPEFKKGNSSLPRPEMRTFVKKMQKALGLKTAKQIREFNARACGKAEPATFDEMLILIGVMVDEANALPEQEGLEV